MKEFVTLLAALAGLVAGVFIAYLLFAPIYLVYAWLFPLGPSAECGRGTALAYLAMLIGGVSGCVLFATALWRRFEETPPPSSHP